MDARRCSVGRGSDSWPLCEGTREWRGNTYQAADFHLAPTKLTVERPYCTYRIRATRDEQVWSDWLRFRPPNDGLCRSWVRASTPTSRSPSLSSAAPVTR